MKSQLFPAAILALAASLTLVLADNTPGPTLGPAPERAPSADSAPAKSDQEDAKSPHQKHALPADEKEFVQMASSGGKAELELAEAGVKQAKDAKVKSLAETLVKDHTTANERLAAAAKKAGLELSDTINAEKQRKITEVKEKSGEEFDQAFLNEMATCHAHAIVLFEAGEKVAKSDDISAFIKKTLPVLRDHAKQVADAGGKGAAGAVTNPGKANREERDRIRKDSDDAADPGEERKPGKE